MNSRHIPLLLVICTALYSHAQKPLIYPEAARTNVVEDFGGTKVPDPYRWLEQLDSPETRAWVKAEAALTDSYLEQIPARVKLKKRLEELLNFERYGLPFRQGNRYFYTYNPGLSPHSILYTSLGLTGEPQVALDPNALSSDVPLAITGYVSDRPGLLLAYGVSSGGSDWTEWHIRDLTTKKDLPDILRWTKYYAPIFSRDSKGLYYSAFPAPRPGEELRAQDLKHAVFYHELGTSQSSDRKLYERPDHPDWQFMPGLTHDGRWLVLSTGEGEVGDKGLNNLYALDLNSSNNAVVTLAEGYAAGYFFIGADAGMFFFQTTLDAARGRIVAIDPSHPARSQWKEIVPQGSDAMDVAGRSASLVNHRLIVRRLHDACSQVKIYSLDGRLLNEVQLPGRGSAGGFDGSPEDQETFYSFTDPVTPPTVFRLDLTNGKSSVYRTPKVPFDCGELETKQVFYPSKDGTSIPMSLVYRKGLKLDGQNPTILYGYGGFGIPLTPHFESTRMLWLERGGVYAVANLRGGGEYGDDWHRQAIRGRKQLVFDDFISGAEWLIAQSYTSTQKLAIEGGSNGGLLVGACVTQRPQLYGAALAYVGVLDMLRFDLFGQGAGWVGDYGSPHNPEDFPALYAYSPYHRVQKGMSYPATLIITGDHDARVMPAHSFKFAAALQWAQAGSAPILLRVRLATGHGAGPTTAQLIEEKADAYAFLLKTLGMDAN